MRKISIDNVFLKWMPMSSKQSCMLAQSKTVWSIQGYIYSSKITAFSMIIPLLAISKPKLNSLYICLYQEIGTSNVLFCFTISAFVYIHIRVWELFCFTCNVTELFVEFNGQILFIYLFLFNYFYFYLPLSFIEVYLTNKNRIF